MKVYEGKDIRNLVVIGHSHSGKTSVVSAMLFTGGATPKLGRVDDGSTVTDHDEEAIARQMTVATGIAPVEWHNCKINLLDTPGFTLFAHEAKIAMSAAEAALVVVDGVSGVEVVTEKVWQYAEEINLPRVIVVSRMDRERANYETALESLVAAFGRQIVPVQLPIGKEKELKGVVDLVTMKAYTYDLGGNGKGKEGPIPADLQAAAQEAHEKLVEIVAEGKDELMEEFFDKGTISEEHLIPALHEAIRDDRIFPVLFASGLGNIGTDHLLDFVVDYFPNAAEHAAVHSSPEASGNGHSAERHISDAEPVSA
ncbi:MAG TPA: GTP-binding protein, partial [Candidatus Acidoferrales bacterium]|nr:GTP-binding protein [Candidatus Acidoferrales bacterium]